MNMKVLPAWLSQLPIYYVSVPARMLGCVRLSATLWTVARQTTLSTGFPKQQYWSGLPFPPLGELSDPGIEPGSPELQVDFLPLNHWGNPFMSLGSSNCQQEKPWRKLFPSPP